MNRSSFGLRRERLASFLFRASLEQATRKEHVENCVATGFANNPCRDLTGARFEHVRVSGFLSADRNRGNAAAARLSGISTDGMVVAAHILSGAFASLAVVLWASILGSAAPETGDDWLITSFAVAIIGGTGLNGGVISALGIFMGAAILMLIKHGLVEVNPESSYYTNSYLGILILVVIVVDRVREIYCGKKRTR